MSLFTALSAVPDEDVFEKISAIYDNNFNSRMLSVLSVYAHSGCYRFCMRNRNVGERIMPLLLSCQVPSGANAHIR